MAKPGKKAARRSGLRHPTSPLSALAPQVLEEAAQGWLQSSGTVAPVPRSTPASSDQRLAGALNETLRELRAELTDLRARLDRLENR